MKTRHHLESRFETKDEQPPWFQGFSISLVTHTAKTKMHQHQAISSLRPIPASEKKNNLCTTLMYDWKKSRCILEN
jgi:hypothetical protein